MTISNEGIIEQLIGGYDLDSPIMRELMERIFLGVMPKAQIAACLALLRAKKASATEIFSAANLILDKALDIRPPTYLFADIVGTGGDGHNTINVSTLASLTAASLGLPVAKHGSIAVSSRCGSADVLTEMGVNVSLSPENALRCLDEHGWCFLFAPHYHASFKSVKDLRHELGIKTIFNILGPLVNPLRPQIMLVGVYDPTLIMPFAETLKNLGRKRALIVHGSGLDEIALHGPTTAALLDDQSIEPLTLTPSDFGLKSYGLDEIKGGDRKDNAKIFTELLSGKADAAKTALVAASAGALLWLAGSAKTLKDGVEMSQQAIRGGEPFSALERIRRFGHGA